MGACQHWHLAFGFEMPHVPDLFTDPLGSKPPILSTDPLLPDGTPIVCPAQVDVSGELALIDVIDLALCNNPQLKQSWAAIKVQAGAVGEARSSYLPTASATYSPLQQTLVNYQDSFNADSITNGKMSTANLSWRLYDFGGRAANSFSANLLLKAALASYDANVQKAMALTIQSYFDVLTAKASLKAKAQAANFANASLEASLRRENKGVAAKSDTLQAQTAFAKAQLAASRAQGDFDKAQAALIFTIGLPTSTKVALKESAEYPHNQNVKALDAWLIEAEQNHPAIKAAKAQWESAKEKIIAARSAGLPTLDFVGNVYQNGYPNQGLQQIKSITTSVGLTITIPIFEGFSTTYKIQGQKAQAEKSLAELEDSTHQILTELVKSHADAVSSLANLEFSEKLFQAASAAVTSSLKRYEVGAADILELLNTQSSLAEAQQERIRCIAEWRSARLRLFANAGILGHKLEN